MLKGTAMTAQYHFETTLKNGKNVVIDADDFNLICRVMFNIEERGGINFNLECPLCGGELDHVYDESESESVYSCENCDTGVAYITAVKYQEYHEVPNADAKFEIDLTTTLSIDDD